ncbi:MAG: energy transducer TonB [Reyranella sp.]
MAFSPQRLSMDDSAAITVSVEPGSAPVAAASEMHRAAVPAPAPESPAEPQAEPQTTAALDPPKEPALPDFAPPLPEAALAPPDFSQPPPPPPKPAQPAARPAQPKPEPKRFAPTTATPSQARLAPVAPAASAESTAAAPAATPDAPATVAPGWNALLAAWLAANRRYPDEARRRHEEGEVTVRFTVAGDGRVLEAALVKGSGVASLDAAAVRLLQGATLPAPGIEATRTVRIRFRLSD